MGKRYVLPIPLSTKKFKFDEDFIQNTDLGDINFRLSKDLVVDTIVTDIYKRMWRVGKPIGRGSFGEIYTASNDVSCAVAESAKYVIKIEPHSSGPLFAEINCLLRIGRITDECAPAPGVPIYIASGSHTFLNKRYRFMIIPRYRVDLHYLLQQHRVSMKNILILAIQILDILEYIHSKGFAHSDIKAQNLMIGVEKCYDINSKSDENGNGNLIESHQLKYVHTRMCNPYRQCRKRSLVTPVKPEEYSYRVKRSLRIKKNINYDEASDDDSDSIISISSTEDEEGDKNVPTETERVYLIDYGLASKFIDCKGTHRMFSVDERRAHDGTLEYSSRDAHFGAHSRRSDLECLGYNLLDWSTGDLPWKEDNILLQPEIVHRMKVCFMNNIKQMMNYCYNGKYPGFIRKYLEYVGDLDYTEDPDYDYCKSIFSTEYKRLGFTPHDMVLDFSINCEVDLEEYKYIVEKPSIQNLAANGSLSMFTLDEHSFKRHSPKNLRSKQPESQHNSKKLRRKGIKPFTWNDILCNTAEDLLQEKLEEMCTGDDVDSHSTNNDDCVRYEGKPTYAIKLVLKSIKDARMSRKGKGDERKYSESLTEPDGLTYAMRLVLEKKNIRDNKENINRPKKKVNKCLQKPCKITKRISRPSSKHGKNILQNNVEVKSLINELKANKCVKFERHKVSAPDDIDELQKDIASDARLRSYKKRVIHVKNDKKVDNLKAIAKKLSYSKSTGTRRKPEQTRR